VRLAPRHGTDFSESRSRRNCIPSAKSAAGITPSRRQASQDISIGYLSHSETAVRLYLQETITFLLLTTGAAVSLAPQT
jgi:hypothetical protein